MDNTLVLTIVYCCQRGRGGGDKGKGAGRTKVRVEEGRQKEEKEKRGWRKVVHIYNSIQIAVNNDQPTCHCAKQLCLLNHSEQCPSVRLFQHG